LGITNFIIFVRRIYLLLYPVCDFAKVQKIESVLTPKSRVHPKNINNLILFKLYYPLEPEYLIKY